MHFQPLHGCGRLTIIVERNRQASAPEGRLDKLVARVPLQFFARGDLHSSVSLPIMCGTRFLQSSKGPRDCQTKALLALLRDSMPIAIPADANNERRRGKR